ncbi:MAG TPA: SpoIIE family protein phosphatase [Nocardioidaceae bacterium]|nr:SpoIIE family protein phosphatase [Nocardioidaceae bacterium]
MDDSALRRRYALALGAGRMGTFEFDVATGEVLWDDAFEQLLGVLPSDCPRTMADYAERVHPDDLSGTMQRAEACAAGQLGAYQHEYRMVRGDGTTLRIRSNVVPYASPDGGLRLVGVCADITERHLAEQAVSAARNAEREARVAAETSHRRLELLANVSSLLDATPDVSSTLQRVAELAIDVLADWCVVDMEDPDGRQRVAIAHRDPAMLRLAEEVGRRWPARRDDPGRMAVLETLDPMHLPVVDDALLVESARSEEHLATMRRFCISSAASVPVQAGGRGLGILSLVATHDREISAEDVELAVELGRHAGSAVERTRLYADRERVTTALQRALLPPALPTIPGVELAAGYEPAGSGMNVGGDFYDVVSTGSGRWWVALGDVQGKGPEAAALTGTIRPVLAATLHETDDPADALRKTQVALQHLGLDERTVSMVVVAFEAGRTPLEIRVASAGHPAPLIRRSRRTPAGAVEVREVDSDGLLLGIGEPVEATTAVHRLEDDEVLLLYTDGATDAPVGHGRRLGDAGLRGLVASAPPKPQAVVDTVMTALRRGPGGRRDDIALLALGLSQR